MDTNSIKMNNNVRNYLGLIFILLSMISCDPQLDDKINLEDAPFAASFSITSLEDTNTFELTNTTPGTFLYEWDLGSGSKMLGERITVFYPKKGNYTVTLKAFNSGGFASVSNVIVVDEDAKPDCTSSPFFEFLTDCTSKSWGLLSDAGALWVGPLDESQTYWQNPQDEVNTRSCAWDDRWEFSEDGSMNYITNGNIWAEDYMGFNFECIDEAMLSNTLSPWAAGNHEFSLIPSGNTVDLQVDGLGAFIGLPKVANGAEVNMPQASITYKVFDYYNDGSKDIIVLKIDAGGILWRFTLESK